MGKKNKRTLPDVTMWTCIAIRLTHLIFQYSGEPDACSLNTQEQNNHILKNFDINGTFQHCSVCLDRPVRLNIPARLDSPVHLKVPYNLIIKNSEVYFARRR